MTVNADVIPPRELGVERPAANAKRYVAEALGTFILVLFGTGVAAVDAWSAHGTLGSIGVGLGFFFALLAGISAYAPTSGAHFNPAITIAFWSVRRFPARDVIPYVVAQCVGAIGAAFLLRGLVGSAVTATVTLPAVPTLAAFAVEFIFSAVFMAVILCVASDERVPAVLAALAIAGTLAGLQLIGAFTGSSVNPARSFGPALAAGNWHAQWLYWAAPISGMVVSALVHEALGIPTPAARVPAGATLGVEGPVASR
jgi:MIP family channel proteins